MENPTVYDYRMYDQIWKRVSPGTDPYGDIHEAQQCEALAENPASALPARDNGTPPTSLPGAEANPCCMGSEAMDSIRVLEGFIEEELAQRRCCLALSCRVDSPGAVRLLRSMATEKHAAVQSLRSAYFLITGTCYTSLVSVDHMRWNSLCDALRDFYHREACSGFNYRRAGDETMDTCLQSLLLRLADESFARAEAILSLLGKML